MRKLFVLLLSTFCISWAFASSGITKEEPLVTLKKIEKKQTQKTAACCATTTETATHEEKICEGGGCVTFTAEDTGTACSEDGNCAAAYRKAANMARLKALMRIIAGIAELRTACP